VVELNGASIDGLTAAFQRIVGGFLFAAPPAALMMLRGQWRGGVRLKPEGSARRSIRAVWAWVILNSLAGPTVGVGCYQWALATEPSGVVLPIVATTPIAVIPFAYFIEGDRPSLRSVLGGVIAVAGAVGLTLSR
jgi:drug/metabolite transporter (DMT)-like permease